MAFYISDADGKLIKYAGGGASASVRVVDNLESDLPQAALSANQGKVLNEKIVNLKETVDNTINDTIFNLEEIISKKVAIEATNKQLTRDVNENSENEELITSSISNQDKISGKIALDVLGESGDNSNVSIYKNSISLKSKNININGQTDFTGDVNLNGNINIDGNIIQNGISYETHAEKVFSKNDYITLREGAVAGLDDNQYAGFEVQKYDGKNNGKLVIDKNGIARVGDAGDEQPLATREETPRDGWFAKWDNSQNKFITAEINISKINIDAALSASSEDPVQNKVITDGSFILSRKYGTSIRNHSSMLYIDNHTYNIAGNSLREYNPLSREWTSVVTVAGNNASISLIDSARNSDTHIELLVYADSGIISKVIISYTYMIDSLNASTIYTLDNVTVENNYSSLPSSIRLSSIITSGSYIVASTGTGVGFYSADYGKTWIQTDNDFLYGATVSGNFICKFIDGSLKISNDGMTWTLVDNITYVLKEFDEEANRHKTLIKPTSEFFADCKNLNSSLNRSKVISNDKIYEFDILDSTIYIYESSQTIPNYNNGDDWQIFSSNGVYSSILINFSESDKSNFNYYCYDWYYHYNNYPVNNNSFVGFRIDDIEYYPRPLWAIICNQTAFIVDNRSNYIDNGYTLIPSLGLDYLNSITNKLNDIVYNKLNYVVKGILERDINIYNTDDGIYNIWSYSNIYYKGAQGSEFFSLDGSDAFIQITSSYDSDYNQTKHFYIFTGKDINKNILISGWTTETDGAYNELSLNDNYLPASGGSINGKLVINLSYDTSVNSFNEGLRINKASNGWSGLYIGSEPDSTSGASSDTWVIARRGQAGDSNGAIGDLTIECGSSSGTGITIQKDGMLLLSSAGLNTYNQNGYIMDQYGNFIHKSTRSGDYWHVDNNAGTPVLSVYFEDNRVVVPDVTIS